MKIVIITFDYNKIGGIEQVAKDIYNSLNEQYNIDIISLNEDFKFNNYIVQKIYNKFLLKKNLNIKLSKYDLIISLHPFLLKYMILNNLQKTICWTHGIDVWGKNGFFVKEELKQIKKIVSVSNFTKEKLLELGLSKNKIIVINNCVNINEFEYKSLEKKLPFKLLTVARLDATEQYKGHDLVIKALKELQNLDIVYYIIGDGNDRERLEQLAIENNVMQNINFLGKVSFNDIKDYYHKCHLFIMPSFYSIRADNSATGEGLGIVYLEAGASGRGVIGCDIGGQVDYIKDGVNGLVVKPSVEDIVEKIKYLYQNWELLEKFGQNGRKIVEEKFNFEKFRLNVLNLLENINV